MSNETKYQYTRAIRFKLNPCGNTDSKLKPSSNENLKLIDLTNALEKIKNDLVDIIYCLGTDGEKTENLNAKIKVKYTWLRSYLKNDFYDKRKDDSKIKTYAIADLNYVKNELETRWLIEWQSIIDELRYQNNRPNEDLTRKPDIALIISRCLKRTNFEFIKEFVLSFENINDDLELDARVNTLKGYLKQNEMLLVAFRNEYLPYQSQGVVVAGGSFNYYTVNKASKINLDKEKEKCENELSNKIRNIDKIKDIRLPELGINSELSTLSLDEAHNFLKKWKAEKKSAFLEKAQKNELRYVDIEASGEFFLFNSSQENFDTFLKLSKEIEEYATERNNKQTIQTRKDELRNLIITKKQERGNFFNPPKKTVQTQNYKNVCEYFRIIALKRGQQLAKIRGIEKEAHSAEQISHWCFIVEKQNKQFLYMVPRTGNDNLQNVKAYIDKVDQQEEQSNRTGEKLHFFESLTLPALRKLCFKEIANTFAPAMKENGVSFPQYEQQLDEHKKIEFYQNVLRKAQKSGSNEAGLNLQKFTNLEEVCSSNYYTMEDFESALSKCCYVKTILFPQDLNKHLCRKAGALSFEITSYDLKHTQKDTTDFAPKNHTAVWNDFWKQTESSSYPLRLNPEIKVTWRDAKPSRVAKYGVSSPHYNPKKYKTNRYLHPQYTLITTFTDNAFQKKFDFSFTNTESIKAAIDSFNDDLEKNNSSEWHYGIDRGTIELATLCIVKFSEEHSKIKPEFPNDIELYSLEPRKFFYNTGDKNINNTSDVDRGFGGPIKNISFHLDKIDDPKWFSVISGKEASCIDLTSAKVIKGKIILNGDIMTLLNLKKIVAQRQIFELFHQGKIDKTATVQKRGKKSSFLSIEFNGENIKTDRTDDEAKHGIVIYRLTLEQNANFEKSGQLVIDELNQYLQHLDQDRKTKNEPPIEKINHLRDAITANMVGVIKYLNQYYPAKSISLENLDELKDDGEKFINSHFLQSEVNISRRFEWALYRTFQASSLVPPSLKETIILKDEFKQQQFGIIKFVTTKGTSSNCPVCNKEVGKYDAGNKKHLKCGDCDLDSQFIDKLQHHELAPLTNADKVAAYNIAKRGYNGA